MHKKNPNLYRAGWLLCAAFLASSCEAVCGQQFQAGVRLEDSTLICEAGDQLGSGGQRRVQHNASLADDQRRQVMLAFVAKADVNRDLQLDHVELQTLDFLTRQQLLKQLDENLDRKLSARELARADGTILTTDAAYPNASQASTNDPAKPEPFRNLRRFGIGLEQPPTRPASPPRSQPFAQAATFGNAPGFRPPRQNGQLGPPPRGGGRCRVSPSTSTDVYRIALPGR